MRVAPFPRIALTWIVLQCVAVVMRLLVHPQENLGVTSPALLFLGLGFAAISGLGIAVAYWAMLHGIAFVGSRAFARQLAPWRVMLEAAVGILSGSFVMCIVNQLFDDDPLLFAIFVTLATFGYVRSVVTDSPPKKAN